MSQAQLTVGLVGAGAMGRALVAGIVRARPEVAADLRVADTVPAAVAAAVEDAGGRPASVAEASAADLVCVAVKPADMGPALASIAPALLPGSVVLSVAAGWDLARLADRLPGAAIVRVMPNLAVRHGSGVLAAARWHLEDERWTAVMDLLEPLGVLVELDEALFPVATALAGSGPGFLALVAEALEEGAVGDGLPRGQAREMVLGVMAGAADLLAHHRDPAALRHGVSSPGGTTMEGLDVLERGAVRAHLADAVRAAARRAREL